MVKEGIRMREIKFRVWIKLTNKMYYTVQAGGFSETVPRIFINDVAGWVNAWADNKSDEGEIMQYTGLKDKNGNEIYEGDIVETEGVKFIIKYSTSYNEAYYAGYNIENKNMETATHLFNYKSLEIIGNIHENPEL